MDLQKLFELACAAIFGGVVTYLLKYMQPRAKLVIWSPHEFSHIIDQHRITIKMQSYSIQNVGHKTAEKIEIVFEQKPDALKLFPALHYAESRTLEGKYRIALDFLAPREYFTLEAVCHAASPKLLYVRCSEGVAQNIAFSMRRDLPRWRILIVKTALVAGYGAFALLLYWGIKRVLML